MKYPPFTRSLMLCAAFFAFTLAPSTPKAEVVQRAGIEADLPSGWTITDTQSGNNILGSANVMLISPDKEAQIILSIFNINETGAESLALGTSERLKGTKPEAADGGYRFSFSVSGTDSQGQPFRTDGKTFVGGSGKLLGTLTCAGTSPDLKKALQSLRGTTPDTQELVNSLHAGLQYLAP